MKFPAARSGLIPDESQHLVNSVFVWPVVNVLQPVALDQFGKLFRFRKMSKVSHAMNSTSPQMSPRI